MTDNSGKSKWRAWLAQKRDSLRQQLASPLDAMKLWTSFYAWVILAIVGFVVLGDLTNQTDLQIPRADPLVLIAIILMFTLIWIALMVDKFIAYQRSRHMVDQIATKKSDQEHAPLGGRPRNADDEWAREQIHLLGRSKPEVFAEWKQRIGDRAHSLADLEDSFDKVVGKKPKKRE